ncbi:MAG: glycosyltransferase, partial [Bacillota bacterium]|nr:glycosyltransferase [Bacillota bacterium]
MKVSVIIPFHRGEGYLRDCLDSLVAQTYGNLEVIVVSDHAPKEDLACVSEYGDKLDVKLHHLDNKTGVAAARNLGLDVATGDYVYFLDSDDYLYENTIELLVEAALDRDDDITYGKKKPTWFQRSVYFLREQEEKESKDQEEESDLETPSEDEQEDDDNQADSAEDPSDDKESTEEGEEEKRDKKFKKIEESEEEIINEEELTEEEKQLRREARTRQAYRILVSKRKGVKNISVLNILFKRSFVEENKLRFPEDLVYLSDAPFLMEALSKTDRYKKRFAALYVKRKHNDAINFPALSQIKDPNRFNELIAAYYETKKRIEYNPDLMDRFEKKYISYYTRVYAPRLKRSVNDIWREENFIKMSLLAKEINKEVIKGLKGYRRRLVKALIKQDVNKSLRIVKLHLGIKKLKKVLRSRKALGRALYVHVFLKRPMKENWILFESFFGKSYSDSPKYIYEYISANAPGKYKCIWIIYKKGTKIPFRHKKIKRFSLRYYYYVARAGYMVFNSRQPEWIVKREGNIFLQTWHGTPLK